MNLDSLTEQFKDLSSRFSDESSASRKLKSFENFTNLGIPNRSSEDWRYSDLAGLKSAQFQNYQGYLAQPQNLLSNNFDFLYFFH